MDRYEMTEKARREGNKGLLMYLEAEEETEKEHLRRLDELIAEKESLRSRLRLTPEQSRKYSLNELREMAEKKSGSPDSTGTATT